MFTEETMPRFHLASGGISSSVRYAQCKTHALRQQAETGRFYTIRQTLRQELPPVGTDLTLLGSGADFATSAP